MNPYEQRRRRVLDQLQFGEMMVLYSGESVACSMDEGFDFEANHHFFYLTGLRRELSLIHIWRIVSRKCLFPSWQAKAQCAERLKLIWGKKREA